MRNALIHVYREVDTATVWQTIHEDLPVLREQVHALLVELGDHPQPPRRPIIVMKAPTARSHELYDTDNPRTFGRSGGI
jgi:Protein of unknown function DUF86